MAIRNKSFGLKNILVLVLGIAFGIVAIAIGYDALSGNAEIRSKAASLTFPYKQWTFASTTEGWSGVGKNIVSAEGGHLQLAIGNSRNVPTIMNGQINVSMPTGKKYIALTIAVDNSTVKPRDQRKVFATLTPTQPVKSGAVVRTDLTQVQAELSTDIDYSFASKEGSTVCTQEVMLCPDGSYVGRSGTNCAFATCPVAPTVQGKPVSMLIYYKLANADWSKVPLAYTGNLSSSYQQFMIPFPETLPEGGSITIAALRITFPGGLSQYDVVRVDDISLLGPMPAPTACNTGLKPDSLSYALCSGKTPAPMAMSAIFTCYDGTKGSVGDGKTCVDVGSLTSQAQAKCAGKTSCSTTPVITPPTGSTGMPYPSNYGTPPPNTCKANTLLYVNGTTCKGPTYVGSTFRCPDGYQSRLTFTTCPTEAQVNVLDTQYCVANNHCGYGTPTPVAATFTPTPTVTNTCQSAYLQQALGDPGSCKSGYWIQVNYTCSDGYKGTLGDGTTCQDLTGQAKLICTSRVTCSMPTQTPTPTPLSIIIPDQTGCVKSPVYTGDLCDGYRLVTSLVSSDACYSYDQCGSNQGDGTCIKSPTYVNDLCNGYRVMSGVGRSCYSYSECQAAL